MAQNLLALDIRGDVVGGVLLAKKARATTVHDCAVAVVGENGSMAEAVAAVRDHLGYQGETCRVCLAPEDFFFRNLSFPFHDKRKIDKILAIELEESVLVDIDEVLIDALVTGKKGARSTVVAAMIGRELLRSRLSVLAECGLDPEIVTIAHAQTALQLARLHDQQRFVLLDAGCGRAAIYVMIDGRMRLIRSLVFEDGSGACYALDKNTHQLFSRWPEKSEASFAALCSGVRQTLYALEDCPPSLPLYLTGPLADVPEIGERLGSRLDCQVMIADILKDNVSLSERSRAWRGDLLTAALALGIRSGRKQIGFNFRKGEFGRKASLVRYRKMAPKIAISTAVIAVIAFAFLYNDYTLRQKELESLKGTARELFSQTMPEVGRIVDPVQQLQVAIREMKEGMLGDAALESDMKMLDLLAEISVRIPTSLNVHVQRLVADRNTILLRGMTDTFNSVDTLKKVLEKSAYFANVTINQANLATRSTNIRFELRLELNRG